MSEWMGDVTGAVPPYKYDLCWIVEEIKKLLKITGDLRTAWEAFEEKFDAKLTDTVKLILLEMLNNGTLTLAGITPITTENDFRNVKAGDYVLILNDIGITQHIILPDGITLDGGGHTITLDNHHVVVGSYTNIYNVQITSSGESVELGALYINTSISVNIKNVHVYNIPGIGIAVRNSTLVHIVNCSVKSTRAASAGFWIYDDVNANTSGITLVGCEASYNGIDGFLIDADNVELISCVAAYNGMLPIEGIKGACGVYVDQGGLGHYNIKIIGGWFHHNYETGITIQRSNHVIIDGCLSEWNDWSGIDLKSNAGNLVTNVVVSNCIVRHNCLNLSGGGKNGGIQLQGANYCTLTGNRCFDSETVQTQIYGISAIASDTGQNCTNIVLTGNNLNYNKHGGIFWGDGSSGLYENLNLGNVVTS